MCEHLARSGDVWRDTLPVGAVGLWVTAFSQKHKVCNSVSLKVAYYRIHLSTLLMFSVIFELIIVHLISHKSPLLTQQLLVKKLMLTFICFVYSSNAVKLCWVGLIKNVKCVASYLRCQSWAVRNAHHMHIHAQLWHYALCIFMQAVSVNFYAQLSITE